MNVREILTDIHALEGELLEFERKYGLRSETFYAAYGAARSQKTTPGPSTSANGPACIGLGWLGKPSTEMRSTGSRAAHRVWRG